MRKFRTWYDARIDEVEVVRETAKYVILPADNRFCSGGERRDAKWSENGMCYHDTWEAARDFLVDREQANIAGLEKRIAHHKETLQKIGEMSQP